MLPQEQLPKPSNDIGHLCSDTFDDTTQFIEKSELTFKATFQDCSPISISNLIYIPHTSVRENDLFLIIPVPLTLPRLCGGGWSSCTKSTYGHMLKFFISSIAPSLRNMF